jgi:hypothetical protein
MKEALIAVAVGAVIGIARMYAPAQGPPPPPTIVTASVDFADVTLLPGQTIVVLRDKRGADQVVVTTFFWQDLKGVSQPVLRNVTEVIPAVENVPVGANGAPDPKRVDYVHLSLVKITGRMEWKPTPAQ